MRRCKYCQEEIAFRTVDKKVVPVNPTTGTRHVCRVQNAGKPKSISYSIPWTPAVIGGES